MCRAYQSLAISLILALHFNYALGNQPDFEIDACDLTIRGRQIYTDQLPDALTVPLSRMQLPVEFYINYKVPEQLRPIIREVALEWNEKVKFELFIISDQIDYTEWNAQEQVQKNVIYWLNEDEYTNFNPQQQSAAATLFRTSFSSSTPGVLIYDSDILMHAKQNTVMGVIHWLLTQHFNRMDVEYSEDMETLQLQSLFIERLSNMNSDDFYNMVIKLMEDKRVTLPDGEPEDIQRWIIEEINAKMNDIEPLTSFEDFRNLIIKEYAFDFTSISNSTVLFKNNLLHEFGHALGLDHIDGPEHLMHGPTTTPVPRFPKTLTVLWQVDDMALHGLSCAYGLEELRQTLPLKESLKTAITL